MPLRIAIFDSQPKTDIDTTCSLARLAQTCKFFQDPALRCLWRDIKTFHPLVKTLPEDSLVTETINEDGRDLNAIVSTGLKFSRSSLTLSVSAPKQCNI